MTAFFLTSSCGWPSSFSIVGSSAFMRSAPISLQDAVSAAQTATEHALSGRESNAEGRNFQRLGTILSRFTYAPAKLNASCSVVDHNDSLSMNTVCRHGSDNSKK